MKKNFNVLILTITLMLCFVWSCSPREQDILDTIYNDKLYSDYMDLMIESSFLISLNKVDIHEIGKIVLKNAPSDNICEYAKHEFPHVRGADLYFKTHCKIFEMTNQLDEKYSFRKLSNEQREIIREKYFTENFKMDHFLFEEIIKAREKKDKN